MRPVRVFEHETVRLGGTTLLGEPCPLRQRDLDALARFNDQAERPFFVMGYRSITFKSMVGYLEVDDIAIEVLPKADRSSIAAKAYPWRDALLAMLEVALGMRLFDPSSASQDAARSSLVELVAAAFARELAKLVQEGLARSYRLTESNGPTFRGRLLVPGHIRANVGRDDRVYVRYSTFDRDIPVNQVLAAALAALLGRPLQGSTRSRLDEISYAFADLSPLRIHPGFFERLALGRSTTRYVPALTLARLILQREAPAMRAGASPVFAMMFDMNILWETYVATMFRRACSGALTVETQPRTIFWRSKGRPPSVVRPDIVVKRNGAPVLIGDTKWKVLGSKSPDDDYLKQMFVYNELLGCDHAVLLQPRCGQQEGMTGTFATGGSRCTAATLGLFEGGKLRHAGMRQEVAELIARLAAGPSASAMGYVASSADPAVKRATTVATLTGSEV